MNLNERWLNHVIFASAASADPGLLEGKTGIILFLMHYAESSGNALYREIANDMLDEVFGDVTVDSPIGLASGLCGVGWGIEYLIQNRFMEGDADEACEVVDRAVCLQKIHPEMDRSLDTGLEGILHYVMARIVGNTALVRSIPFETTFLRELYEVTQYHTGEVFALFNDFYTGLSYEYRLDPVDFIPPRIECRTIMTENTLGLRGLTGHLFTQFFE